MKKLFSIAAICLLCAIHSTAAEQYTAQWQKGNSFFVQKQYDSAAYYYEQVAALKPQNAAVYYNLGNAYYRLNKVALAILNYQRALVIDPNHINAKDNLLLAQNRISTPIPAATDIFFIRWWHSLTRANNANILATVSLVLFVIVILLLLLKRLRKPVGNIPPQVTGSLFVIFLICISLAAISAKNAQSHDAAVVMQSDVPLMNDQQKGKPLVLIPEGTTVKIKDEKGDWVEVSLPDGRRGWVQQSTLNKI